ncbi:uncharacterized protein KRP23_7282 [Phytophthora ramorum]|uniref:uncharacterized protein n=1 Tax=Phytophthora ramorum TaxID=164328 RepID=UPI0030990180|nr:hypothetical protein KRP23_7282 [Phytophthora ramorum]
MASCSELPNASDAALPCLSASELQVDVSSCTLALLAASDLPPSSQNELTNVATTALHLERSAAELLVWLQRSDASMTADDALFFFETRHPELLDDLPLLFAWLSLFLAQHADADVASTNASLVATRALQSLDSANDNVAAVAEQFELKSALTLLYWRHEAEREKQLSDAEQPRVAFQDDKHLMHWVLAHRQVPLTRQDVVDHVLEQYPAFAASKSAAALKVWTARFLKKHLPPHSSLVAAQAEKSVVTEDMMSAQTQEEVAEATVASPLVLPKSPAAEAATEADAPHGGKRRSCSGRYMLFSNEFKLHAVNLLDGGKSIAEVAQELGLKNPNCLNYWRSIRDKLVTSERKRFRLAGGGRPSSCTFEDELLTWVSERHQRGQGTDVKSVLEYMRQYHASFTEGKKEPTLRKWILRFFKRCWRAPSTSMDSQDSEKSYIFV